MKLIKINIITILIILSAILVFPINLCSKTKPSNMTISESDHKITLNTQPHTGLYNLDALNTINLEFKQTDWWQQLTNNYNLKKDIPATLIFNGITYNNVGVRFRGQTSYQMVKNSKKKSFNISIDFVNENQRLDGYKTLNLNNCFEDPSFMKEILYNQFCGNNIPSSKSNFVKLVINGENWGIYSNVQQLNREFYQEWFLSSDGHNWRADYPDTSTAKPKPGQPGGFGEGFCTLNYLGDNSLVYSRYYTLKSTTKENPWADMALSTKMLNTLPVNLLYDSLKYYLDVDRSLWHIANEIILTDDDGYVNKGGMDYYVYFDIETGRIQPIEYDGNSTFMNKNSNWSIFLKETNTKYPLINRLLANPELKQRYIAHVRSIINNILNENYTNPLIDKLKELIDSEVNLDTKKLYSYSNFQTSINDLKSFLKTRKTNITNSTAMLKAEPPIISNVHHYFDGVADVQPIANEKVNIQTTVTSTSGINKVFLYYGTGLQGIFNKIEMFDDGNHKDGFAGDGRFAADIPGFPAGTYVRYYIEAIANNNFRTAAYEPEGAEHDVYFYQVNTHTAGYSQVVINEFMASNSKTIQDPQGDYDDWIELYNKGNNDFNLTGMYLTDKVDNLKKWKFPDNTIIKANDYLIVWADENSKATPGIHTNFKLSADGEVILLINTDANGNSILDSVSFGVQKEDVSFGRYPNGTGDFLEMPPTPGHANSIYTSVESFELEKANIVNIYPNPFRDYLNFDIYLNEASGTKIFLNDILGNTLFEIENNFLDKGLHSYRINTEKFNGMGLSTGVYILYAKTNDICISKKIIKF